MGAGATRVYEVVAGSSPRCFPLPGVPLKFQWVRQRAYRERPETLGGHLRKRRCQSGLLQREVAAKLGVDGSTYLLWEQDRSQPTVRYYPAIYTSWATSRSQSRPRCQSGSRRSAADLAHAQGSFMRDWRG